MRIRVLAAVAACAALLAACTTVVDGKGSADVPAGPNGGPSSGVAPPSGSATPPPSLPTLPTAPSSSSAAAAPTPCPHVVYPAAKLAFDCIATGMTAHYNGQVWPVAEARTVEASTSWVLEEGAGHWGSPEGSTLADIAFNVRLQMISVGGYGDHPGIHTVADRRTKVDGAPAHLLQTTFTINRAWARANGTKVKQEKLWIIAIQVAPNDVSLWYTSLPDLVKQLWKRVPATIASIRVG